MANLYVTLTEEITLPNNNVVNTNNFNPGKTLILNDAEINASSVADYMAEGYVDEMYYSSFQSMDTIKAKAIGSNIQLEYFVASL